MAVEKIIKKRYDDYFQITKYYTSHTGQVSIKVENGDRVEEGDVLYTITRLDLIKKRICDIAEGVIKNINKGINNRFCGYYTHILNVVHKLTPEESQALEEETHYKFITAPQGAQYYITTNPGMPQIVSVGDIIEKGYVVAISMVMKKRREIVYDGVRGRIAKIYFMNGQQVGEGGRLFGVVPKPIRKK